MNSRASLSDANALAIPAGHPVAAAHVGRANAIEDAAVIATGSAVAGAAIPLTNTLTRGIIAGHLSGQLPHRPPQPSLPQTRPEQSGIQQPGTDSPGHSLQTSSQQVPRSTQPASQSQAPPVAPQRPPQLPALVPHTPSWQVWDPAHSTGTLRQSVARQNSRAQAPLIAQLAEKLFSLAGPGYWPRTSRAVARPWPSSSSASARTRAVRPGCRPTANWRGWPTRRATWKGRLPS